jgi:CRP/FNR family transcriptional regulator, cyclic AMP receptor protein
MTKSAPVTAEQLKFVSGLNQVPLTSLQALVDLGVRRDLCEGQTLQLHGDVVKHISLVLAGKLIIGLANSTGQSHIVRPIGAGEFLNLLPAFDGGKAIHDVHAGTNAQLLQFEVNACLGLTRSHPLLRDSMLQILHHRNRLLYTELADIALMPLRQRCANLLVQLSKSYRWSAHAPSQTEIEVSQTELAQMLGFSRPIVNRELRQLAIEGILELSYARIKLLQPAILLQIATRPDLAEPLKK